jgi:arginase
MPVSFLLGIGTPIPEFSWITGTLRPSRIVYIGLRDVEQGEKRLLKENNIKAFSMHEVDKYGIGKVVEMALDAVNPNRDLPIHLSFDVDALDPSVAPSTGTPVCPLPPREGERSELNMMAIRFGADSPLGRDTTSVKPYMRQASWSH